MKQVFTDKTGRQWRLDLTVRTAKRLRDTLELDLFRADEMLLAIQDPVRLCDIAYLCCEEQACERHVSDEEFGRSLDYETVESIRPLLTETYIRFFPEGAAREAVELLAEKIGVLGARTMELIKPRMKSIEAALDTTMDRIVETMETEIERSLGDTSSNWPESPASSPAG